MWFECSTWDRTGVRRLGARVTADAASLRGSYSCMPQRSEDANGDDRTPAERREFDLMLSAIWRSGTSGKTI